jgi:hypothetical protein
MLQAGALVLAPAALGGVVKRSSIRTAGSESLISDNGVIGGTDQDGPGSSGPEAGLGCRGALEISFKPTSERPSSEARVLEASTRPDGGRR